MDLLSDSNRQALSRFSISVVRPGRHTWCYLQHQMLVSSLISSNVRVQPLFLIF